MNMPYESTGDPIPMTEVHVSGGVTVGGVLIPVPGGTHPGVLFRFARPDGSGFMPPVLLAPDDRAALPALPALVEAAVTHVLNAHRQGGVG